MGRDGTWSIKTNDKLNNLIRNYNINALGPKDWAGLAM